MSTIWRIRDRSTFVALRRQGRRARAGPLTLTWVPGAPGEPPRVAYAVGRAVGSAVVRNRLRRRLRAVLDQLGPELAPGAYLIAAAPAATSMAAAALQREIAGLVARVPGAPPAAGGARRPADLPALR